MKFAVVTCTGGRPELFALCKRWVERQTRKPDHWFVVSDFGDVITGLPDYASFHAVPPMPEHYKGPRNHEPAWALTYALNLVPEGWASIPMEDDDWYAPHHCEILMQHLERGSLVSYGDEVYYFHLPAQRWSYRPGENPTEGCVGIHPEGKARYLSAMLDSLQGKERWDPKDGIYKGFTKVDIKGVGFGLPGRSGTTSRHDPNHKKARIMRPDPGNRKFRELVGKDADAYLSLVRHAHA